MLWLDFEYGAMILVTSGAFTVVQGISYAPSPPGLGNVCLKGV